MGLGRGYAGAAASAIACRNRALAAYYLEPKTCATCGCVIEVRDGEKVAMVRLRKFCNSSCAAQKNNRIHPKRSRKDGVRPPRNRLKTENKCTECLELFFPFHRSQQFCGRKCSARSSSRKISKEELFRRGITDPIKSRQQRMKQLSVEENLADDLRSEGWEIFSPTVVCDRVGVKDGKVFFLEFKPINDQRLRAGQQRIAELVPDMYRIIAK